MSGIADWVGRWRFSLLLMSLATGLVIEPMVAQALARTWLFNVFYSLILITGVVSLGVSRRMRLAIWLGGGLSLVSTWAVFVAPQPTAPTVSIVSELLNIGFLSLAVYVTVRTVIGGPVVTLDSIAGALAGYLLLGVTWSRAYMLLYCLSPTAFRLGESLLGPINVPTDRAPLFLYYSFVTLTTLGYGDMTPVSPTARTLSWVEAVSGQFYVAVLVAGLVGALISSAAGQWSPDRIDRSGPPPRDR